jgi:hypothetical protein
VAIKVIGDGADSVIDLGLTCVEQAMSILLLCVASNRMVVMGIFPGDVHALHPPATILGVVHWTTAGVSFLSIMTAAFLLSVSLKGG